MKKLPYILKDLSIQKMPGFPRGLKSLNDLAANVNIIAGANASGKSSTTRMIQQLIWQDNTQGLGVEGSVSLGEDSWEIKIDSGRTSVQRNGVDDQISGLPTVEGQHRYLLALHNLVEGKEIDLAKEIAKQSIGGFDLDAAQEHLGYVSRISNKGISEYKNFELAERKFREVRDQQRELKKEEESLLMLRSEKKKTELAKRLNEYYDKVADYLEAKLEYTQLADQINAFPKSMEKLSGDEYERIQDYEGQIEEWKSNIEKAKDEIENSQNVLETLIIPEGGIGDKTLSEIEERIERLSDFERDIRSYDQQIASFKTEESIALEGFDNSINPSEWKGLNIEDVSGLDKLLQDAHQVLGEKEFLVSEIKILEAEADNYQTHKKRSEVFTLGIKTLSEWLKEPVDNNSKGTSLGMVILIALAGILTAITTYFLGWVGLLGLIVIVVLFLYVYFTKDKSSNSISVRENDFKNSGLKVPSSWNTENVANRIDELIESLSDLKEADRISQRLKNYKISLEKLEHRIDKLNTKREEWVDKLQAAPGFPESNPKDFSSLYWFLQRVKKWQDAYIQRNSLEAKNEALKKQYHVELSKINTSFENSNFKKINDVTEGKSSFKKLKDQENTRKEQVRIIGLKRDEISNQEKLKEGNAGKLSKIYHSLEIGESDKESVRYLVNQLDNYKQIFNEHYAANQSYLKEENLLQEHSLYMEYKDEIQDLSIDLAKEKSNQNHDIADGLEDIQKQITEIETLIQSKKKGHELEDVLTEKEEALDNLHQAYESNLSSITGDLVINQLKNETQNKNRPKVFKRAYQIFNRITNGRYELLLNDKGEPNFRAYDTVLKLGQDLSELSTGTRVQLLLSVRLAYVETVESSIKLPLLADELLANSDDERAKAIIESLIEISREGRQVFYFTAQADEVGKWLANLEQTDLEYKIFQLNGGSNKVYDYSEFRPDPNSFRLNQRVPEPNGKSHQEYGKEIQKQPFNILIHNSSELHLWYLINDVDILHACLNRGIIAWGQLESFYSNDGEIQNLNNEIYDQLQNRVWLLKRFQELYQRGRSRSIDREVLEASGAITPSFIDRVVDKLNQLNQEPKQLIQALRDGEISRFRADNADDLEQYLMTEGYIDDQEILGSSDIIIRLHAFLSNSEMEIEEAEDFIDRILRLGDVTKPEMS